jgi:amidohydrolase
MTAPQARDIDALLSDLLPAVQLLRRELHAHPEIALDETRTRATLGEAVKDLPLTIRESLLGTDLVAELDTGSDLTVCLRADMDALAIDERTGCDYASENAGLMHACGHDGHMAMLVGAAHVLCRLRRRLGVNVRFVFQPGEEMTAAGGILVRRGILDGVAAAFALHAAPELPIGCVACREGAFMAANASWRMDFRGRGGHGAMPDRATSPLPAASTACLKALELHARLFAEDRSVVSPCSIHAGSGGNVIPDEASLEGTVRFLKAERKGQLRDALERICLDAAGEGVRGELHYRSRYPLPVVNTPAAAALVRRLAEEHLGPGSFREMSEPLMVSEDFAFYLKDRPGAMFLLGMGEDAPALHNPAFNFNDEALGAGIRMLCLLAIHAAEAIDAG